MAPEQPASRVKKAWHETTSEKARKASPSSARRRKIFGVLAAMLALIGGIVAWLLLINPFHEPAFFTIPIDQYDRDRFPVNAFARYDSDGLFEHFKHGTHGHDSQERTLFLDRLEAVRKCSDKVVVLHLIAYARTYQGKLYVLPANAAPDVEPGKEPVNWVAMDQVLDALRECPAAQKLLIVDIMHSLDDPLRGTVPDDIAGRFQELFKARDQNKLLALCACSPGQVSLISEDLAHSVFGFYLDEALCGFADGYNADSKKNARVSLSELAAFVSARVDRWAVQNRGVNQTPVLLGDGAGDFDLVFLNSGKTKKPPEPHRVGDYPPMLQQGWKRRDAWLQDGTYPIAPRLVRRLEVMLMRYEQQWRGGIKQETVEEELAGKLAELQTQAARAKKAVPQPAAIHSLFIEASRGQVKVNAAVEKLIQAMLDPKTKPDDVKTLQGKFPADVEKGKVSYADVCWTVLQMIFNGDVSFTEKARIQFLLDLLKGLPEGRDFVETIYLRRLADLKIDAKDWPKETVRLLFDTIQEAEKARACGERRFPLVRHLFAAADARREEGEKLFFTAADVDAFKESLPDVTRAWGEAKRKYNAINDDYLILYQESLHNLDEGLRLLPGYLPFLVSHARQAGTAGARSTWNAAVDNVEQVALSLAEIRRIAAVLTKPAKDRPAGSWQEDLDAQIDKLRTASGTLKNALNTDLRRPLKTRDPRELLRASDKEEKARARDLAIKALYEIDAILETAWPTADEREKQTIPPVKEKKADADGKDAKKTDKEPKKPLVSGLWHDRRYLARELLKQTREQDEDDNRKETQTRAPEGAGEVTARQRQAEREIRARLSLRLLRLAGLPKKDLDKLEELRGKASNLQAKPAAWDALADALHRAWSDRLPELLGELLQKEDLAGADRVIRILHPLNRDSKGHTVEDSIKASLQNPALLIRQQEARDYWNWLAGYYENQSKQVPGYKDFYRQVAKDYADLSE